MKFIDLYSLIHEQDYPLAKGSEVDAYGGDIDWKGKIVYMTPEKFLSLAAPLHDSHIDHASVEKLKHRITHGLPTDPLVLTVDMSTKKVTGHEGRHRAKVCMSVGVTQVPVLIFTGSGYTRTPKWTPEQHREVEDVDSFIPEK